MHVGHCQPIMLSELSLDQYDYYDQFINDTKFDKYDFYDQFINDNNDPYYYYDLPLTLNLSYFPVSFPESSTRDPYLGETLLWNEKSWIIFRLGHHFNRFRLMCDLGNIWRQKARM